MIFLALALVLVLQSCMTVGRIERNCDKFLQVCGTEKERVVVYRDTTVFVEKEIEVPVPHYRDSVRIRDSVNVITVIDKVTGKEKQVAQMDTTTRQIGMIKVVAWVNDSKIGIDAWLTDSTFLYNYQDSVKVDNGVKVVQEKVVVEVKYVPGFYKFTLWFFIVTVLGGCAVVYLRFKNMIHEIFG